MNTLISISTSWELTVVLLIINVIIWTYVLCKRL